MPLADAGIAADIARIAARGRGADRAPTLEQLLAAFDEHAPTDAARRRVAAALRVAGIGVRPEILEAEPGQRMLLLPPGAPKGPSRGRALGGLALLTIVLVAAVVAATLLGASDEGGRAIDDLPSTSTVAGVTTTAAKTTATSATPAETTETATTPAETTDTETATTPAETTSTDDQTTTAEDTAAQERRDRAAAARRRRAAAARRPVTVRVDATERPTFLCVDDGDGKTLFNGTLDRAEVFKGSRVRLNIGLASTTVLVNGNAVRLEGSPTGLDITRGGGARVLPLGQRPCA